MRRLALALLLVSTLSLGACGDDGVAPARGYDAEGRLHGGQRPATRPPNLVLVVIDTLRAGQQDNMPFLGELAADGVRFSQCAAPAPWTGPSLTSLLTGLLPSAHGCDAPLRAPRLLDAVTTYAEALQRGHGYETAAFTSGPWITERGSILQGFGYRKKDFALQALEHFVGPWLERRDADKPFFLLLHTFEAHDPYGEANHPFPMPPKPTEPISEIDPRRVVSDRDLTRLFMLSLPARIDLVDALGQQAVSRRVIRYLWSGYRAEPDPRLAHELRAAYEDGVRWVDGRLRHAVERLRAFGLLENTVLVVASDHGEAFGEHGILEHGRQLYDELVRVPLVVTGRPPFTGGKTLDASVGLIDVLPTFFDHAGLEPLTGVDGRSFLPTLGRSGAGRPVFSEEQLNRDNTQADVRAVLTSVRTARWKYILTYEEIAGRVIEELDDLEQDPREQTDLAVGGRLPALDFDADFCTAVETARDRIWGAVEGVKRRALTPYASGEARVTAKRPEPCR